MDKTIHYPSGSQEVEAYLTRPKEPKGCIVVLHEVWGLNQQIKDVCKRLSKLGFATLAPDLYTEKRSLLTPQRIKEAMEGVWELSLNERRDIERVKKALSRKKLPDEVIETATTLYDPTFRDKLVSYAISAIKYAHQNYTRVSALGFCMGGGILSRAATSCPELSSAIVFYGEPPPSDSVSVLNVPLLLICASHDELINSRVPAFVSRALELGKDIILKVYPNTRHGFFNETNTHTYNEKAAKSAWDLTRWFLSQTIQRSQ